jgi:hypothetical protein
LHFLARILQISGNTTSFMAAEIENQCAIFVVETPDFHRWRDEAIRLTGTRKKSGQ